MSAGYNLLDGLHMAYAAAVGVIDHLGAFSVDPDECEIVPLVRGIYDDAPKDGKNGPVGAVQVRLKRDSEGGVLSKGTAYTVIVL